MKHTQIVLLGTLLIGTAACSGPMVETRYDQGIHFSELSTFAWQTPTTHQKTPQDQDLDTRIRPIVEDILKTKGFRPANDDKADLLLDYQATLTQQVDTTYMKDQARAEFMGLSYTLGTFE